MDVEEALFRAFILPSRKGHYVARVGNPKTREKLLWELDHRVVRDLDPRYTFHIGAKTADDLYALLRGRGAPERCHVMSGDWEMDGRDASLKEVLRDMSPATLISCIPGRLALYQSDDVDGYYLLERTLNDALRD